MQIMFLGSFIIADRVGIIFGDRLNIGSIGS